MGFHYFKRGLMVFSWFMGALVAAPSVDAASSREARKKQAKAGKRTAVKAAKRAAPAKQPTLAAQGSGRKKVLRSVRTGKDVQAQASSGKKARTERAGQTKLAQAKKSAKTTRHVRAGLFPATIESPSRWQPVHSPAALPPAARPNREAIRLAQAGPSSPVLPTVLPEPSPASREVKSGADTDKISPAQSSIDIKGLRFTGNTVIPEAELQQSLNEYVGTRIPKADLRKLTARVGLIYRQRGYLAHAYVRPESHAGAQLELIVVESKLGEVRVGEGSDTRLEAAVATGYITAQQEKNAPLQPLKVSTGLRILNEVPGVSATSTLAAGTQAEQTDVVLNLKDKPLVSGSTRADNNGSKATGTERVIGNVAINNPSGQGDQVSAIALVSSRSQYGRIGYEAPLGRSGLRAGAHVGRMSYKIKGALSSLENKGNATNWGGSLSYPLIRDSLTNLTLTGGYDKRNLLDNALNVRVMSRDTKTFNAGVAGSHRTDWGLTTLGATYSSGTLNLEPGSAELAADQAGPRAQGGVSKINWNVGQQLPMGNKTEFAALASGQFASKNLDSGEKFYLGGPTAIRGYSSADGQGDEGWLTKLELRHSMGTDFRVIAFADMGSTKVNKAPWAGWNASNPDQPNSYMLFGTGVGFNWTAPYAIEVQASVALPIGRNPGKAPGSGEENNFIGRTNAWVNAQKQF